ncbi:sel1 repeat family protein [Acinetobacter towneri]|nr:sel1 repeat family protein [Acinetobacter towneri]
MISSRTKLSTIFAVVLLSPVLLIGCQKIHSTTSLQTSQVQSSPAENDDFMKLKRSAEQGNAEAQYRLGLMYDMGEDIDQDYGKAFEWYEKSANQGLASSQSKLGSMYRYGKGVVVNHAKASEWYWKAYEQGNEEAHYQLGTIYISNKDKFSH